MTCLIYILTLKTTYYFIQRYRIHFLTLKCNISAHSIKQKGTFRPYSQETTWQCGLLCVQAVYKCVWVCVCMRVGVVPLPGRAQWKHLFSSAILHVAVGNQMPCSWPTRLDTWSLPTFFTEGGRFQSAPPSFHLLYRSVSKLKHLSSDCVSQHTHR